MKSSRIVTLISAALFSSSSFSDFVGLNIGSSIWNPEITGSINSNSNSNNINIGSSSETQPSFLISFEHPVPLLPNIKFENRELNTSGSDSVSNIQFNNQNFNGGITSTLDLSHNDIILYYELLDNWVNLDVGINIKTFDGEVTVSDNNNNESITIDETIPLLYLSARFDLPFTGFYVGADIQNLNLDDNSIEDSTFMIGYEASSGFGIEGGYKKFTLEFDDADSLNTAIKYDGVFINGYFHF